MVILGAAFVIWRNDQNVNANHDLAADIRQKSGAIKRTVTEGVGIGFVPSISVQEEERRRELTVLQARVSRKRELRLVHRRDESLSPAAQSFLKISLRLARQWATESRSKYSPRAKTESVESTSVLHRAKLYC